MTDITELAQSLQDHFEQHHGICLQASQWDAVADYITRREAEARAAGAKEMQERCAGVADEHAQDAWKIGNSEGQNDVCSSGRNHGARAIAKAIRSQP